MDTMFTMWIHTLYTFVCVHFSDVLTVECTVLASIQSFITLLNLDRIFTPMNFLLCTDVIDLPCFLFEFMPYLLDLSTHLCYSFRTKCTPLW